MKRSFSLIALMLISAIMFAQSSKEKSRMDKIREMYAQTNTTISAMKNGEDEQVNWSLHATIRNNESAVGVVTYEYEYYPLQHVECWDMLRLKRTTTVFPADVYEMYYENGVPAFYFETIRSYQDEGCHVDTRVYWYANGTLCSVSKVEVDAKGNQTPIKLTEKEKTETAKSSLEYANALIKRCKAMKNE